MATVKEVRKLQEEGSEAYTLLGSPAFVSQEEPEPAAVSPPAKLSIREMKACIVEAGLNTDDLVERPHVEERYREALAKLKEEEPEEEPEVVSALPTPEKEPSQPYAEAAGAGSPAGAYDYAPPPNLLDALRGALPYWGQGAQDVETNARNDVLNATDEEINRVDPETGDTCLLLSAQYGAGGLVELLVEKGADVDVALPSGATTLHYMTNSSTLCPEAVIALLAVGADPSVAEQHTGATALMYAADAGSLRLCEQLVKHGADAQQVDFQGYDALGYASGANHADCVQFLVSQTASSPPTSPPDDPPCAVEVAAPPVSVEKQTGATEAALHSQIRALDAEKASLEVERQHVKADAEKAQKRAERADEQLQLARQELAVLGSKHQQALDETSTARGDLEAARVAADKASRTLLSDATGHKARADEAEGARQRASQRADDALERAIQAEARLERAREDLDNITTERDAAKIELDDKADALTALEIERQLDMSSSKARDDALGAAHAATRAAVVEVAGAVQVSSTPSSSAETDAVLRDGLESALKAAEARLKQAAEASKQDRADADKTQSLARASAAALDAALRDQGRLGRWAERLKGDRDAAKKKFEVDAERAKNAEARASACQAKADADRASLHEKLKDEASKRAWHSAATASEKQRADKAEERAKRLESELLSLAQAASGDARDAALESAHKARLDEAEHKTKQAEALLEAQEEKLRNAEALLEEARLAGHASSENTRRDETVASLRDVLVEFDGRAAAAARLAIVEEVQKLSEGLESMQASQKSMVSEGAMEAADQARKEAREELERVRAELSSAREASAADRSVRAQLEASARDAAGDRDRARANFSEVREQVMRAKADLLRAEAERDAALNGLEVLKERREGEVGNLETRARTADDRAKKLESEVTDAKASLRRKNEFYDEKLKRAEGDYARQRDRDEDDARRKAREAREGYLAEISGLREEASIAQAEAARYRDASSRLDASTNVQLDRVQAAEACCDALRRRVDDLTAELEATYKHSRSSESSQAVDREKLLRLSVAESELRIKVRDLEKRSAKSEQDLTRESALRRKLHNQIEDMKGKIRVLCRVRPFSQKEDGDECGVVKDGEGSLTVLPAKESQDKKRFRFDSVFEGTKEDNSQAKLFEDVRHLITSTLDGYNVCLFAYGQTGSGKTYTMGTDSKIKDALDAKGTIKSESAGIAPRAAQAIFDILNERGVEAQVSLQMFEIYCDKLVDLMHKGEQPSLKITLAEHSATGLVVVDGAKKKHVRSASELVNALGDGIASRTVHATKMNSESSRSHLVMAVEIHTVNKRTSATTTGKLTLVDLAGSERVDRSGAVGQQLKEAASINKSLSALGDVINALTSAENAHVPYRNHPLTMLMSDSVGGSAKTMMLVCSSPAHANISESVSSFQFATRCKDVVCGSDPRAAAAEISKLKAEVAKLKGSARAPPPNRPAPHVQARGPATLAKRHSRHKAKSP